MNQDAERQEQEEISSQESEEGDSQEQSPLANLNKILKKAAALSSAGKMSAQEAKTYAGLLKALKSAQGVMNKHMQDLIKAQAKVVGGASAAGTSSGATSAATPPAAHKKVAAELEKARKAQAKAMTLQHKLDALKNKNSALKGQAYQAEVASNLTAQTAAQHIKQ